MNNKKLLYLALVLAVLAGLFIWLKPAKAPVIVNPDDQAATLPEAKTFDLTIKDGAIVSGPKVLTVGQGDRVIIKVTADVTDELHLHGYDLSTELTAGKQGGIIFTAATTGRFAFELEKAHAELGTLEVLPRP